MQNDGGIDWLLIQLTINVVIVIALCFYHYYRFKRLKRPLEMSNFIVLTTAVASSISSCNLIRMIFVSAPLRNILGYESIVLMVGAVSIIWIALKEISKIFT